MSYSKIGHVIFVIIFLYLWWIIADTIYRNFYTQIMDIINDILTPIAGILTPIADPLSSIIGIIIRIILLALVYFLFIIVGIVFSESASIYKHVKLNIMSYLDSVVLTFIYVFVLTLITSGIIYLTNNLIGLSMQQGLILLLIYYILEISTLFLSLPFREYPTSKKWRSWPTIGIFFSTLFAFIYLNVRYRYIDFCKVEGIYITWALTRYNIVNPVWIRPKEQTENYDSGLKGMLSKLDKKPTPDSTTSLF